MLHSSNAHSIICTRLFRGKMHSDWFNGIEILQGRWQHGKKLGYCYPSGLEKILCKWDIYVPLVTKELKNDMAEVTSPSDWESVFLKGTPNRFVHEDGSRAGFRNWVLNIHHWTNCRERTVLLHVACGRQSPIKLSTNCLGNSKCTCSSEVNAENTNEKQWLESCNRTGQVQVLHLFWISPDFGRRFLMISDFTVVATSLNWPSTSA